MSMASLFGGRSEREVRLANAYPLFEYVESPVCQLSEYYYMRWLTDLFAHGITPDQYEAQVSYNSGRKVASVVYIQKDYLTSAETKLILRSNDEPILEGMVVRDDTNEVMRPLCSYARYDHILGDKNESLNSVLESVGLGAPPTYDALTIILSLLGGLGVQVGDDFEANIREYSEIMKNRGNIKSYWGGKD